MRTTRATGAAWPLVAATVLAVACGSSAPTRAPNAEASSGPASTPPSTASAFGGPLRLPDVPFMRGDAARSAIEPGPGPVAQPVVAWDTPIGDLATVNPILVAGLVLTATADEVVAIDGLTGAMRWHRPVGGRLEGGLSSDGGIVVVCGADEVHGLEVATGAIRWSTELETTVQRPAIVDGVAYVGTTDGLIVGIDLTTGKSVWSWQGPRSLEMRVDLVIDGTVYVASNDGRLFTVSIADRSEGWTYQAPSVRLTPSRVGDTIFVSSQVEEAERPVGQVVALDRTTGRIRWRFAPPTGQQAVHGGVRDGLVIVTTRGDGAYGLRDLGGSSETAWDNPDVPTTDWPSVLVGGVAYVATRDRGIYALDVGDGHTLWHTAEHDGDIRGPIVSGGLVFAVLGRPSHVIAWAEPGLVARLPGRSSTPSTAPTPSALAQPPNPLTVIRSFDAATTGVNVGTREQGPEGTQMAFGPDGLVYVIDQDARISKVDPETGISLRPWGGLGHGDGQFDGGHDLAVAPDGQVYVSDAGNHRVQVFTASGAFERQIGTFGAGLGQFGSPNHLGFGPDGSLFVEDGTSITRFDPHGNVAGRIGGPDAADVRLRRDTYDFAVRPDGRLLVALDPGGPLLVVDPASGAVISTWGPHDIAPSPEPVVAPDGRLWMFQYVPGRIDVFDPDGTRVGTVAYEDRDATFPYLYPTPVIGPNGHAYSFEKDLGLVELAVSLPHD